MIFELLGNIELLTLCIFGEARGESLDGKLAVASVVINRVNKNGWYGKGLKEVILKRYQFSCFLENDKNYKILENIAKDFNNELNKNKLLKECYWIAKGVLEGYLNSNVGDATHYHANYVSPSWASRMVRVKQIGAHIFYKEL